MEGHQELTPTSKDQKTSQTAINPLPEQTVEPKNNLASRLMETKASAHSHAQAAIQFYKVHFSEEKTQELNKKTNFKDTHIKLDTLVKEESLPPSEYISKSKQALQASTQLKEQAVDEQKILEQKISSRQNDIWYGVDERIRELDQKSGFRKIPAILEKKHLERRKAVVQKQIDQLEPQVEIRRQLIKQITQQEVPIRLKQEQKQEELILTEIGNEIRVIQDRYEQLLDEVFQEGTVTAEVRDAYIQQVIAPKVDKVVEERKLPTTQKDAFYTALNIYLNNKDETDITQREIHRQQLENLFTYEAGFWEVKSACEPLFDGHDKTIISRLVAKIAAEDIMSIKSVIYPHLKSYGARNDFEHLFDRPTEGGKRSNNDEGLLGRQIFSEINANEQIIPEMELWKAMTTSKTANEVFGEVIQHQDQEYYASIMNKSLFDTDGGYIDDLYFYPTPDAIRNLVVLAAADYENYRTVHANWVLDKLRDAQIGNKF